MGRKWPSHGIKLIMTLNENLQNSWIELVLRWFIGGLFIYASFHKIVHPDIFAKIVYGYGLFPHVSINLIAIIIPYIELITGLFLIFGIFPKGASFVINCLLLMFIALISINLLRGHEFDCGCFSADEQALHSPSYPLLIRDLFYLIFGLYVFMFNKKRKFCFDKK